MKKHDRLDEFMKNVIHEEIEYSPEPLLSKDEAWQRISKELNKRPNHYLTSTNKAILIASCLCILFFTLQLLPKPGDAFQSLTKLYKDVQGTVTTIFGTNLSTMPEIVEEFVVLDDGNEHLIVSMTLEEAKELLNFPIQKPAYVPEGFELIEASVIKSGEVQKDEVYLHYENAETKTSFVIYEKKIDNDFGFGMTVDNEDTDVKQIKIHGQDASLITYKDQTRELTFMYQHYFIKVSGELSEEDIISVANSIF